MYVADGGLILSPTDLTGFLACPHLAQLERQAARGDIERPLRDDPELDVLTRRGDEHERDHLRQLEASGLYVVRIERAGASPEDLQASEAETLDAMRAGADIIFQATFFDGRWVGYADFLRKVEGRSHLGSYHYEVEDTKLARRVKPAALLQLCSYAEHVQRLQGRAPSRVHVVLGDGRRRTFSLRDISAYYRRVKGSFEEAVAANGNATYPEPVQHCSLCRWFEICDARWRADDHLSLVAGMRRDQIVKLNAAGVGTVTELAAMEELKVTGIGDGSLERLQDQARLQLAARERSAPPVELVEPEEQRGLCLLPEPSPGDLFFDMEGDPYVGDGGLEYLFGVVEIGPDGESIFHAFWAHDPTEEKRAFEDVVDLFIGRLEQDPDLHIFHYAPYETTAMKRLMGRHATREEEIDRLLRGGVFVDLYRVVRQGLRVGTESYSIKSLEPLYMDGRDAEITDAASSIVAYEQWLEERDPAILDEIRVYNRDDCISTRKLRDWLEARRAEAHTAFGTVLPRPVPQEGEASDALSDAEAEVARLAGALTEGLLDDPLDRDADADARWLLAHLLSWHRREAKSSWWAYFERLKKTPEELREDPECIAGLEFMGNLGAVRRSYRLRYRFDPRQDHKFRVGEQPLDPATGSQAGTIEELDTARGEVVLTRAQARLEPHPHNLIPDRPLADTVLRQAVQRVATEVIACGLGGSGRYQAAVDLLRRKPPRIEAQDRGDPIVADDEEPADGARRIVGRIDRTCLPIQGPPGAGKTYTAARMVIDLVAAGKRVGVTALSHKAIGQLLDEVCLAAAEARVSIRALQKAADDQRCSSEEVACTTSNEDVENALRTGEVDIVAGTAWLFARPDVEGQLDVLFVDEAGQLPLANAVAVSTAADSLVLVGDPQQLSQPSQGSHPPGSEVSALEHLLRGHETIPPEAGIFLEETRRLHPEVCAFISEVAYEERLEPHPDTRRRELGGDGPLSGAGLRVVEVPHLGNRTSSREEAGSVAALVDELLGRTWTDTDAEERPITIEDVLIVAPYNAQVNALAEILPDGSRIGTVDRFQGQQAPVVIYSMATSAPDEVPRGLDFLFSLNRLNVAISRAQALAVMVLSPALLEVRCRRPEEVRLVNAVCRYVELARSI